MRFLRRAGGLHPASIAALLLGLAVGTPLSAQRYLLANGSALDAADVTLKGDALVQTRKLAGGGSMEQRFPLATITRLDWPEPTELAETAALITAGHGQAALAKITPLYRQFDPFPKTPGSWWTEAAMLRLRALLAAGSPPVEITAAARDIMGRATDPEAVGNAKLALAEVDLRGGKDSIADALIDQIVTDAPAAVRARAWLLRGDLALKRKAYEQALEAYLRVPALFGTLDELMPAALLGSARAYKGYGDKGRAERAYLSVMDEYPNSAEAAVAKAEAGL
ncbi:MAG TPA: hypothetical protein VGD81_02095 [Opitutaceae bacterium]